MAGTALAKTARAETTGLALDHDRIAGRITRLPVVLW